MGNVSIMYSVCRSLIRVKKEALCLHGKGLACDLVESERFKYWGHH